MLTKSVKLSESAENAEDAATAYVLLEWGNLYRGNYTIILSFLASGLREILSIPLSLTDKSSIR